MDTKYELVSISIDMTAIMSLHQETSTQQQNNFTTGQSWGALRKAWKGYRIAKVQDDNTKMTEYATKIRKIQEELGVSRASFPHLGIF
jgi:CHAD domain-containing protein